MNLFGRKKDKKKALPSLDDAINSLREAAEQLSKREQHLRKEKELARAAGAARMKAKDKPGAMFYLRRMKVYDKQISQLYGKQMNLDGQLMALQSASVDRGILEAMQSAQVALKSTVSDEELDRVHDIMDDIEESTQMTSEMSDILSRTVGMEEIDDDDLLAAFEEELEETVIEKPKQKVEPVTIPEVPKKPISTTPTEEVDEKTKDELAQLDALLS